MFGFGWNSAFEILIFWIGIYLILRNLGGTRGLGILKGGVGFILALYLVSKILESQSGIVFPRLNFAIENLVTVALIGFVIIFQPELRRGLTRLGQKPFSWLSGSSAVQSISPIAEAAGHMSRRRIGALIVVERNVGIGGIIESGVPLAADVSAPLLESIFYPNAPLHDGAVVVRGNRVVAASCLLPLSDSPELGPEVGTRHRAAVGLTEETDALVVVVSEQSGRISLCYQGEIAAMRDTRDLEMTVNIVLEGGQLNDASRERSSESRDLKGDGKSGPPQKNVDEGEAKPEQKGGDRLSVGALARDRTVRIDPPDRERVDPTRKRATTGEKQKAEQGKDD
ncbi:MAG: diadenylate cyclase CdaA [Planctomycetota bacterium]